MGKAIGTGVRCVEVAPEQMLRRLRAAGSPVWLAADLVTMMGLVRTGDAAEVTPTVQEITRKPARTVADFVRNNLGAFRS
jgi:hypothetical protein